MALTPEEQAELERLERELGTRARPPIGRGEAALATTAQGASLGIADELAGLLGSAMTRESDVRFTPGAREDAQRLGIDLPDVSQFERFRDLARGDVRQAREQFPTQSLATEVAGGALTGGRFPVGVGTAQKLLASALLGGAQGAGSSEAPDVIGTIGDALGGASVSGAISGLAAPVGAGMRRLGRFLRNPSQELGKSRFPSEAAEFLRERGVPLTPGQRSPRSAVGMAERAGESVLGPGTRIQGARDAAEETFQAAVLSEAVPPGGTIRVKANIADTIDDLGEQFGKLYDQFRDVPLGTAGAGKQSLGDQLKKSFQAAVDTDDVLLGDAERKTLGRFLDNQASKLRFEPGSKPTAGELLNVRSKVRQRIRDLAGAKDKDAPAMREVLGQAEEALTEMLEKSIGGKELERLRDIDRKYAAFKTVEAAQAFSRDQPGGFTPAQLSRAVNESLSRADIARGRGGTLRDFARSGVEVFEQAPHTGARIPEAGGIFKFPVAMMSAAGTTRTGRDLLEGRAPLQTNASRLADLLGRGSGAARATGRSFVRQLFADTLQEDR